MLVNSLINGDDEYLDRFPYHGGYLRTLT